jgi:hypothetical protein
MEDMLSNQQASPHVGETSKIPQTHELKKFSVWRSV